MTWRRWTWGLFAGALAGFAVGHLQAAPDPSPTEPLPVLVTGLGPDCPPPGPLYSENPDESPPPPAGFCADAPPGIGPLVFDVQENPVRLPPEDEFWFGSYRGRLPTSMGQASLIDGVPMQVAQLFTRDDPNVVRDYLLRQFALNHVHPAMGLPAGEHGPLYMSVAPPGRPMRTVILVPAEGGTMILASIGTPKHDLESGLELPPDFPAPEGYRGAHVNEVLDGNARQRDLSFQVHQSLDEIRQFYEKQLPARGYAPDGSVGVAPPEGATSWREAFARGQESVTLEASRRTDGWTTVTALWINPGASKGGMP